MKNVVSTIALCLTCDWTEGENSQKTIVAAKRHAEKFGHKTSVEIARVVTYDGTKKKPDSKHANTRRDT